MKFDELKIRQWFSLVGDVNDVCMENCKDDFFIKVEPFQGGREEDYMTAVAYNISRGHLVTDDLLPGQQGVKLV